MFSKLKNKIKEWTKKTSEELEGQEVEEETPEEQLQKEEKADTTEREIEVPMKFNVGTQKFEPDLDALKEIQKDAENKEQIDKEPSQLSEKRGFFKKVKDKKQKKLSVSEKKFSEFSEELEMFLLENNVALEVVEKIISDLKNKILEKEIKKREFEDALKKSLKEILEEILIEPFDIIKEIKDKTSKQEKEPYVILFCGINGTGKTTTIAKLGNFLKSKNISSVFAAADTFRAASIEQIKKHGENLDIKVISNKYGSDPASVGFDAVNHAKKHKINCVLIDTAGRMHTDKNLLKEIEKISRVCKPDLKIFVGESITGNDSIEQIKKFDEAIGIDAIILSKADIDEKGGTAISLGYVTKKPILFLGTGQEYNDLEVFNKKKFIEKLGL